MSDEQQMVDGLLGVLCGEIVEAISAAGVRGVPEAMVRRFLSGASPLWTERRLDLVLDHVVADGRVRRVADRLVAI